MILYLVRHGESLYNAECRIQGQTDVPLSPVGVRQSLAVAQELAPLPIEAVYSSPLCRAFETARPIAAAHGQEPIPEDRLKEIHAGIFQGLLWSEIEERCPEHAVKWREQDPDFCIPGGESRRALMARGQLAFEAIREKGHRTAVIVAHGGILTAALKALLGIPAERNPFNLYNASVSKVAWEKQFRLITLNQIQHLRAAAVAHEDKTGDL